MKHSVLLITLLGFGFFAPFTCSKNKTTKEEAKQEERHNREMPAKQMALYGPTIKVVSQNKA